MNLVSKVRQHSGSKLKRVVLPESEDLRVLRAASFLIDEQICEATLIGSEDSVRTLAAKEGIRLPDGLEFVQFDRFANKAQVAEDYYNLQKHKGITRQDAEEAMRAPLFFGASLTASGFADACVAGSIAATGDVIRAALKCIGLGKNSSIVSSIFLMEMPDGKIFTYADCGVVPYPDSQQLAEIAIKSAQTHRLLTGKPSRVALLSFSTKGSAVHERTKLVTDALEIAKSRSPNIMIDGELQFDAAFVPEVAKLKAPDSAIAGKANVFIFPNLDAGNIAYKITERLAGAVATGPILQGLAKPMMDLSRGCSWQDIVNAACAGLLLGEDG